MAVSLAADSTICARMAVSLAANATIRARMAGDAASVLCGVDPGEPDHDRHHHHEKEQLDPDRDPDQPARPPRPLAAPLAVGGVRNQRPPALVTDRLNLGHYSKATYSDDMDLEEEMTPADVALLMSSVPERIGDLVYGLDERSRPRGRAQPPPLRSPRGFRSHPPPHGRPPSWLGQDRVGPQAARPARRRHHPAGGLPDGGASRDLSHRADPEPDRPAARAAGARAHPAPAVGVRRQFPSCPTHPKPRRHQQATGPPGRAARAAREHPAARRGAPLSSG